MDRLKRELEKYGISPSPSLMDKYSRYMEGVLRENEKINLTAIRDEDNFIEKHYIDSLAALKFSGFLGAKRIIDVGTGGGFPGIPLALACPDKEFVLLDSLAKRLKVVSRLAEECGIENVEVIHGRAEDLGRNEDYRESFDISLSRAVAPLPLLSELCLPFVKTGGYFMAYKGKEAEQELEEGRKALEILGAAEPQLVDVSGEGRERFLILAEKREKTQEKYPRKAGIPEKRPLK